ncbi:ABC transporter ATP-binding protein [archaeon]|nr:ABC transporter ATP-binding protein [archaeon]
MVQLKDIKKTYKIGQNILEVLKGISLNINKNEFVAIQGQSGSGKTTLMNIIGILDSPSSGTMLLEDKNISNLCETEKAKIRGNKIGFVFQSFNLIPTLTALENVMLPSLFQGSNPKQKAELLLGRVGLGARMGHKPSELSGGECQRVAIARALINAPELILADEPTGNLDFDTGREIISLLKKIHKERQSTIIMVTHESDIAKSADRIIKIRDGRLI